MDVSQRTALYRLFNAAGELLYIGITWQPLPSRMNGHAMAQPWWHEVHHATASWYETRAEADQAETEAILSEHPKYNIAKTVRPRHGAGVWCFSQPGIIDGDEMPTELLLVEGWLRGVPAAHADHLLGLSHQGVELGVIPDGIRWTSLPYSSFTLHENPGQRNSYVVIDLPHERMQITEESGVARYRTSYKRLRQMAVHGDEAVEFVREIAWSL